MARNYIFINLPTTCFAKREFEVKIIKNDSAYLRGHRLRRMGAACHRAEIPVASGSRGDKILAGNACA